MIAKDKDGFDVDTPAILYMESWLDVLAAPRRYRMLTRPADPDVLLKLLDIWIARAERSDPEGERLFGHRFDAESARALRAPVAAWKSHDLPAEVTEAARGLLRSMGKETAPGGVAWDDYTFEDRDGRTLDSYLIWSEGLDEIVQRMARYEKGRPGQGTP
jgi:hypothetical protein